MHQNSSATMRLPLPLLRNLFILKPTSSRNTLKPLICGRNFHNREPNSAGPGASQKLKLYGGALVSLMLTAYLLKKKKLSAVPAANNSETKLNYNTENNKASIKAENQQSDSLRKKFNFINKIVKQCAASVFYLEIRDPSRSDPETGEPLVTSNGSGFLISDDGWALTNAHVVLNKANSTMTAIFKDGKSYAVQIEDLDVNMDLALLKVQVPQSSVAGLKLEESGDTSVGEWVIALGSPLSLSNSVTVGIVSCVDRPGEELGLKNFPMTYIQTDASITFGNSGGPLVNLDGRVIGINNLRLTSGISFAIPIEYVKRFLENSRFKKTNELKTAPKSKTLFGIITISVSHEVINELMGKSNYMPHNVSHGLLVWKLLKDSPAYKSGLEVGDIITSVNGSPVKEASDLYRITNREKTFQIDVIKNGVKQRISIENVSMK